MAEIHVLHIGSGQDVSSAIYDYLKDKNWNSAIIMNGIGSVIETIIGNPITHSSPPKMAIKTIKEPAEVLGFIGEIIRKENAPPNLPEHTKNTLCDYIVHSHITISHGNGNVSGGGYRGATVMRALNLYIQEID